jgi:hypothetical protein
MARKKDMWTGSGKFVRALKAPSQNVLVSLQRFSMLVITITLTEKKRTAIPICFIQFYQCPAQLRSRMSRQTRSASK